jgi:hypothetical protein
MSLSLAEEDHGVGGVPGLHHVEPFVDLPLEVPVTQIPGQEGL